MPKEKKRIDEGPINEALINDLTIQAFAQMSINLSGLPMAARKNTKTSALRPWLSGSLGTRSSRPAEGQFLLA